MCKELGSQRAGNRYKQIVEDEEVPGVTEGSAQIVTRCDQM